MLNRYEHKKITWIDLESPTTDEVGSLMKEFNLHPVIANELLGPTMRPKVDLYDDSAYLILHFPAFMHKHGKRPEQEVDFVLGKNFIITVHYAPIDVIHDFSKIFEVDSIVNKKHIGKHAGFLFYHLVIELYKSLAHELTHINEAVANIENNLFSGKEREMVLKISEIHRNLLYFKQALNAHEDVLTSLEVAGKNMWGNDFAYYLTSISGEYYKISNNLDGERAILGELRDTNDSLVSTSQNETMKILTIMAFVTFPLSLIAGIFGMNTEVLPIVGTPGDFWIIISIMGTGMIAMFLFFKYKKWL